MKLPCPIKVQTLKSEGPARAEFSINLVIEFDPNSTDESQAAIQKPLALLLLFHTSNELQAIWEELSWQIGEAATWLS